MNFTSDYSLGQDMALAAEVQKHPCLYNRNVPGYKKEEHRSQAWAAIGEALGVDKDLCARKFENMKKRYSKKRCSVTKAVEAVELARAKKNLEAYSFLDWLNPYIRIRTVVTESILNESKSMVQIIPQSQNLAKNNKDNNNHQPPFQVENEDMGNQNEATNKTVSEVANGIMRKRKRDEKEVSMSEEESFSLDPPTMGYVEPVKISDVDAVSRNADQAFANMVAAELSSFPPHIKYCIKHEINNIFFKYHTAEFEQQNVTAIPTPDH